MATQSLISPLPQPKTVMATFRSQWFAVATVAKHEKAVARHFQLRSIEHYLPLYTSLRQWKDRRVTLELPLFSGYIFARIRTLDKALVEQVPGVLNVVGFGGGLVAVREDEMERLRKAVEYWQTEPCPYLSEGKRVRVCSGPLAGLEGIVLRRKAKVRLVISVDSIMRSMTAEVDTTAVKLEPVRGCRTKGTR